LRRWRLLVAEASPARAWAGQQNSLVLMGSLLRSLSRLGEVPGPARTPASPTKVTYRAFVSYSHAVDGSLAPALQAALHRFAKPWYVPWAVRVFRDQTSLSATPALWPSIQQALAGSQFFILLASPEAAASQWVGREVEYWFGHKPLDQFLIVLTDGELAWDPTAGDFDWQVTTALPRSLSGRFAEEPRFVDLRWARAEEHLSLAHPRFRDCVADLAAPLHDRPKDELIGEDVRQHRRTRRLARAASASLATLTAIAVSAGALAFSQRSEAIRQRNEARVQRDQATSRQLAAQGTVEMDRRRSHSLLLALQALQTADTAEARGLLLTALRRDPQRWAFLPATGGVQSVAFSPDKRTLAVGATDGRVTLADVQARSVLATLETGQTEARGVSFNHDGSMLAAATEEGDVVLWDTRTWTRLPTLEGHGSLNAVAFNRAGTLVAAVSDDQTLILWQLPHGRPPSDSDGRVGDDLDGHHGAVFDLAFSPDGQTIASGGDDGRIVLWDVRRQMPRAPPLASGADTVFSVAFSPDGRTLAAGQDAGSIALWDVRRRRRLDTPPRGHGKNDDVSSVAFSPDGRMLASGGSDGRVVLWGGRSLRTQRPALEVQSVVEAVAFGTDGRTLAAGSRDQLVGLWDIRATVALGTPLGSTEPDGLAMAFNPEGTVLASGHRDGTVRLVDIRRRRLREKLADGKQPVNTVAFSPTDVRLLAAAGGDGTVKLWDVQARRLVDRLPSGTGKPALGMAFSPDGRTLAVSSFRDGDGVINLWDVQQRRLVREVVSPATNGLAGVAFRAAGRVLAAAGGETVVLWNLADPSGKPQIVSGPAGAGSVAFSPDGRILARVEDYTSIRLWDLERRAAVGSPLVAHTGWLVSLAFSPDGRTLASSDTEGTIRLWNVEARTALGEPLRAHDEPVRGLAFSPDGQHLASVGDDGRTMLWDVGVKAWQARACAAVAPLATAGSAGFRPDSVKPSVCEATGGKTG
jgi:WD40 repeat protein